MRRYLYFKTTCSFKRFVILNIIFFAAIDFYSQKAFWTFDSKSYTPPFSQLIISLYDYPKDENKFYIKVESNDTIIIKEAKIIGKKSNSLKLRWEGIIKLEEIRVSLFNSKMVPIDRTKKESLTNLVYKISSAYKTDYFSFLNSSNIKIKGYDNVLTTEKINLVDSIFSTRIIDATLVFKKDNSKLYHLIITENNKSRQRVVYQYLGPNIDELSITLSRNYNISAIRIDSLYKTKKLDYTILYPKY